MEQLGSLIADSRWDEAATASGVLGLAPAYVAQLHLLALADPSPAELVRLLALVPDLDWVATAALQAARRATSAELVCAAVPPALAATDALAREVKALRPYLDRELDNAEQLAELCRVEPAAHKLARIRRALLSLDDRARTFLDIAPAAAAAAAGLPFATFIRQPLLATAAALAAAAELDALSTLCRRHADELWPDRLAIIDAIPEWVDPVRYLALLPAVANGVEQPWAPAPWRADADWAERVPLKRTATSGTTEPFSAQALSAYCSDRSHRLAALGLVRVALALVQHCASRGVAGLDELGEELSLLSKLVYDRPPVPSTSTAPSTDQDLTLAHWRTLSPPQVLRAYLAHSTASTLAADIRRLVLPYLSVIESRLERAGTPDPSFGARLLDEYVLELPPALLVAVFEASKPTLPRGERLIKNDADLARLALACLYGCQDATGAALAHMGHVFECLPAFAESLDDGPHASLFASFPASAAARPAAIDPTAVFDVVREFAPASLSLALDALDVHLATAETFARYSVPVPLSWFLTAHDDPKAQRAWATRMARTSASGGGGRAGDAGEFESEDEWEALMEDMVQLTERAEQPELSKAFWTLERDEVLRIFFAGLLAAGKFGLAKNLFGPSSGARPLAPSIEEELVIAASREFYDNAETGNLHKGDMKLAFDCLGAAPQSPTIRKERDFIEATSRLCSYNIQSYPGVPVSPIEIRLSKDRLDFVAKLLAANDDAYRHPDVVLDLVAKLGFRGDRLAEIRVLAMIAASGLQAGDFVRAADVCDQMVAAVELLRKQPGRTDAALAEAADVAWQNCFQLGKHEPFGDLERRMRLLGQALVLCPGTRIAALLPVWTALEDRLLVSSSPVKPHGSGSTTSPSLSASYLDAQIPPAAALAAETTRTLSRAAAFFPFGGPDRPRSSASSRQQQQQELTSPTPKAPQGEDGLRAGISSRLTAGVGWLIGADESMDERRYRESSSA